MGFYSWKTVDSNESISNRYSIKGSLPVALLIPKEFGGGALIESSYEGYGTFAGKNAYALLAQWNTPEKCTGNPEDDFNLGIDIGCFDHQHEKLKYKLKFVTLHYYEKTKSLYENVAGYSINCPDQGYFY